MNGSEGWTYLVGYGIVAVIIVAIIVRFRNQGEVRRLREERSRREEEVADRTLIDCTLEERSTILNQAILEYVNLGWRVISQTPTTAQLVRNKRPNGCLAFILLLFFIVPCILYLLLYKGTESCYLEVNIKGRVTYHYAE